MHVCVKGGGEVGGGGRISEKLNEMFSSQMRLGFRVLCQTSTPNCQSWIKTQWLALTFKTTQSQNSDSINNNECGKENMAKMLTQVKG